MRKPPLLERLRAKKRNQSIVAGVTWYTEETWTQLKVSATDPEHFEESFQEWQAMAISALSDLRNSGVRAVEFHIIPQEFFAWCALNSKADNAASRAEFVSGKLNAPHNTRA